jgi:hypothetical protein
MGAAYGVGFWGHLSGPLIGATNQGYQAGPCSEARELTSGCAHFCYNPSRFRGALRRITSARLGNFNRTAREKRIRSAGASIERRSRLFSRTH